jgi:NAD(P)-dependent dehydrogenase (short-subunit alcohol dehydrogenase family)
VERTKTIVVVGGSRGIGAAVAAHLEWQGHRVLAVSRGRAAAGEWVAADLLEDAGLEAVVRAVGEGPLDALLYLGGAWEHGAFTADYDFMASPREETRTVIGINLVAPILLAQALAPALSRAPAPRVVLLGAWLDPPGAYPEVANAASKAGLHGAARALDASLARFGIGVTVIDPANVATDEVEADIAEGRFGAQRPIPLADVCRSIDFVLSLSADTVPARLVLAQQQPAARA